jgi:hypothetical protein
MGGLSALPPLAKAQTNPGSGMIEATGTHFELLDSDYLNVTLDSSEPIRLFLHSTPEMILMDIGADSTATSTTLTISGFAPDSTYHK